MGLTHPSLFKRRFKSDLQSDSLVPTREQLALEANLSSPNAMDIDPKSPAASYLSSASKSVASLSGRSLSRTGSANLSGGAPDRLANLFADDSPLPVRPAPVLLPSEDLSLGIGPSKKRGLMDDADEEGPNSSPLARAATLRNRSFEKSLTMNAAPGHPNFLQKRRPSHHRRPSLQNAFGQALLSERERERTIAASAETQQPAKKSRDEDGNGRPSLAKARRAHSVCDGPFLNSLKRPVSASEKMSTYPPLSKPRLAGLGVPLPSDTDETEELVDQLETNPARRVVSMTQATMLGGQSAWAPAFGSEADGKALPCHSVKDDGLMRIKPAVVSSSSFYSAKDCLDPLTSSTIYCKAGTTVSLNSLPSSTAASITNTRAVTSPAPSIYPPSRPSNVISFSTPSSPSRIPQNPVNPTLTVPPGKWSLYSIASLALNALPLCRFRSDL